MTIGVVAIRVRAAAQTDPGKPWRRATRARPFHAQARMIPRSFEWEAGKCRILRGQTVRTETMVGDVGFEPTTR